MNDLMLRDYQEEAVSALLGPPKDVTRSLAVLPTGSGKTVNDSGLKARGVASMEWRLLLSQTVTVLGDKRLDCPRIARVRREQSSLNVIDVP
jgi:hypothetical protein